jgi:hypothetical protein
LGLAKVVEHIYGKHEALRKKTQYHQRKKRELERINE